MLPAVDFIAVRDEVHRLVALLRDAYDDVADADEPPPDLLVEALTEALDAAQRATLSDPQGTSPSADRHLARLCDHGIDLITRLAAQSARLGQDALASSWERLVLPYACCAARHGGEIGHLATLASASASLAEQLSDTRELERLHGMLDEIIQAASPAAAEAAPTSEAGRAWQTLVINRALAATRSRQPELMRIAFDALADQLPSAAPDFFREAMAQVQAAEYPAQVKDMLRRYYETWSRPRRLH